MKTQYIVSQQKPMSIKFDPDSRTCLLKDSYEQEIPISALVRRIVRKHYKLSIKPKNGNGK